MKSARSILTSKYTWATAFVVCCLITFGLDVSNTRDQCTWNFKGISIHGSGGCMDGNIPDNICTAAMVVERNDVRFNWNGKEYPDSPMRKKCSWHSYTSAFNYLAILCDAVFVVFFFKNFKRGHFKRTLASGGAALGATIIASILMILDNKSGSKQIKKMENKYSNGPFSFSQSVFDANIAFSFLSMIFVIVLILISFKVSRDNNKNTGEGYKQKKGKAKTAQPDQPEEVIRI